MMKKKCLNKKYRAMLCTNEPTDPPLLPAYKHPAIMAKNLQRLNAITQKLKTEQSTWRSSEHMYQPFLSIVKYQRLQSTKCHK